MHCSKVAGAIFAGVVLTGCSMLGEAITGEPISPTRQLQVACEQTYPGTLRALAVHRRLKRLSEESVRRVDAAKAVVGPICRNEVDGSASALLAKVEEQLIIMATEQEMADVETETN